MPATRAEDLGDTAKRNHICNVCSKSFKRSEHCIRHQRAHTQEKPFSCKYCKRKYSRKELVTRHEKTIHAELLGRDKATSDHPEPAEVQSEGTPHSDDSTIVVCSNGPLSSNKTDMNRSSARPSAVTNRINFAHQGPLESHESVNDDGLEPRFPDSIVLPLQSVNGGSQLGPESLTQGVMLETGPDIMMVNSIDEDRTGLDVFVRTADNDFFLNEGFNDLDFFELLPGLQHNQLPNFVFEGVSPLEQSHTPAQASAEASVPAPQPFPPLFTDTQYQQTEEQQPRNFERIDRTRTSQLVDTISTRLPRIIQEVPIKPPLLVLDRTYSQVSNINAAHSSSSMSSPGIGTISQSSLQKCLRTYVSCFHVHLPFLHLQTLDLQNASDPLVLAMCAIGALFRLERKVAASLYTTTNLALQALLVEPDNRVNLSSNLEDWARPYKNPQAPTQRPICITQCKLLIAFFAAFSGDPVVVRKAIEGMGSLSSDSRALVASVKPENSAPKNASWRAWTQRETTKRLLHGVFVLNNLLTVTYGIPPLVSIVQDGEVELPDDEALWSAATEGEWRRQSTSRHDRIRISLSDAVARLMYGKDIEAADESTWDWTPFTGTIVMHAVSVQLWHVMQSTQSFSLFAVQAQMQDSLKSLFTCQIETALGRCHAMISLARSDNDLTWNETEGPFLFNCLALTRIAYVRAFTGTGSFDRTTLMSDDLQKIHRAIQDFVASPQTRSLFLSRAIARAFEGFLTPIKAGSLLVQKTAALNWSIEHAIAGWDCALFFTKWVHVMERLQRCGISLDEHELQNMQDVRNLLSEIGCEVDPHTSLAAELTKFWAGFYDDTWVWGVTPKMGWMLRELAATYSNDRDTSH